MRTTVALLISVAAVGCTRPAEQPNAVSLEPDAVSTPALDPVLALYPERMTAEQLLAVPIEPVVTLGPAASGAASPAAPLRATAWVRFDPPGATSLDDVRSITFDIDVAGARRGAELALELVANQSLVYERRTATLWLGAEVPQRHAFELQVAGTMVRTSQLSGSWTATFVVDGQEVSALPFGLTP